MAHRMIFPNLPVRDLARSKAFFAGLGFGYNPRFTDERAACMVVNEQAMVMLLQEDFYRTFTRRPLCDTARANEGMLAFSCESRAEVDALWKAALSSGGAEAMPAQDHGFMYSRSFYDPDGHHWEVFWMDPQAGQG